MGHKNLQNAHPKKYGKGGRGCRVCGELWGWVWVWMMTTGGWGWAVWCVVVGSADRWDGRVQTCRLAWWWSTNGWMADGSRLSICLGWQSPQQTGNGHGLIRKYELNMCRQCFRDKAADIGFIKARGVFIFVCLLILVSELIDLHVGGGGPRGRPLPTCWVRLFLSHRHA
jgi:ribosomal protein S14